MTKDVFKLNFKRLCDGFEYHPRPMQVEAFWERLQHCHEMDLHHAVTDLLCAPYFPKSLDIILDAVEKRADQRRRSRVHRDNAEAEQTMRNVIGMRDALSERPDLLEIIKRIGG